MADPGQEKELRSATSALAVTAVIAMSSAALPSAAQAADTTLWHIRNAVNNWCLSSDANGNIYTYGCNRIADRMWRRGTTNPKRLQNYGTSLCLGLHDTTVKGVTCGGTRPQEWNLVPATDGRVKIQLAGTSTCLDSGMSYDDGGWGYAVYRSECGTSDPGIEWRLLRVEGSG